MNFNLARASAHASAPALYGPSQDNSLPEVSLRAVTGASDASCEALDGLTVAIKSRKTPDLCRDPRIDPKPGDEIVRWIETAKAGCVVRLVVMVTDSTVFYTVSNGYSTLGKHEPISEWCKWAEDAEVLSRGEA